MAATIQPARCQSGTLPACFEALDSQPVEITYRNRLNINNRGGHLQGVQFTGDKRHRFAVISGSSNRHSYLAVINVTRNNEVLSVNRLFNRPFKHAGGIQIFRNLLVVGIEDNDAKDKSKVCIYDVANPEMSSPRPLVEIQREGEPLRSTAGCTGITEWNGKLLVVVGDWDTKNLDFYTSDEKKSRIGNFALNQSLRMADADRSDWIDKEWHAYQNINLFNDGGKLYLIGLGQNGKGENIADLYILNQNETSGFQPVKIGSRSFICTKGNSFRAGAGAMFTNGQLQIVSCSSHIERKSVLNVYSAKN